MSDLKPCPFCGSTKWPTVVGDDEFMWYVECRACYSTGAESPTRDEAIAEWNRRDERTCEFISSKGVDRPPMCSACGYEPDVYDCEWYEGGTYGYVGNYCPNCGAKVVQHG